MADEENPGNVNVRTFEPFGTSLLHPDRTGCAAGLQLFNMGLASRVAVLLYQRYDYDGEWPADPEVVYPEASESGFVDLSVANNDPDSPRFESKWHWVWLPEDFGCIRLRGCLRFYWGDTDTYVNSGVFDVAVNYGVKYKLPSNVSRTDPRTWPLIPNLVEGASGFIDRPVSHPPAVNSVSLRLLWPSLDGLNNYNTPENPGTGPNMVPHNPIREQYTTWLKKVPASSPGSPPVEIDVSG